LGVVLTRVDGRNTTVNEAVMHDLEHLFGELLLSTRVGVNTTLAKAQFEGASVFEFDPKSRASQQYQELGELVLSIVSGCLQEPAYASA